jgi:hypothetical protein
MALSTDQRKSPDAIAGRECACLSVLSGARRSRATLDAGMRSMGQAAM